MEAGKGDFTRKKLFCGILDRVVGPVGIVGPVVETNASATIDAPTNQATTATEYFMMQINKVPPIFSSFFKVF